MTLSSKIVTSFLGNILAQSSRNVAKNVAQKPDLIRFSRNYSSAAYASRYADYDYIQVKAPDDHILHVELNRPDKRNALNRVMFRELASCFAEIANDQQCRAVVISGTGKMFCSGIDILDFAELMQNVASGSDTGAREDTAARAKYTRQLVISLQNSISNVLKCPKPVIAAIHSGCIGAGVDLISATDIRYASKDAYFSIREVALGMAADLGTLQRLPKIVGNESVIREMAFTARDAPASEAKEFGLLSGVYEDYETCLNKAIDTAKNIVVRSPVAVQGTKIALNYSRDHSERDGLEFMQIWNMCMLQSEDLIIATSAASAKNKAHPPFQDF